MIQDLSCATQVMYQGIADDPPDMNFAEIAMPVPVRTPLSGDPTLDSISAEFSDTIAYGTAQRISMERYQGAVLAGDTGAAAGRRTPSPTTVTRSSTPCTTSPATSACGRTTSRPSPVAPNRW